MSSEIVFRCSFGNEFDLFGLKDWVKGQGAAGKLPAGETVRVKVEHPDREGDGSCRWCGEQQTRVVEVRL